MRVSRRNLRRKSLIPILLIVSLLVIILPRAVTGRFIGLVQALVPFQDWTSRGVDAASGANDEDKNGDGGQSQLEALRRRNAALSHQLAELRNRYRNLQRDYRAIASVRRRGLSGGRLIPARVVAADALPWRESRLISSGLLSGVQEAAGVTSNYFNCYLPQSEGVRGGLSVVASEVLVGFVDQVSTHAARVRLITDRSTKMPVVIARPDGERLVPLEAQFWLVGTGGKALEVRDVDHRYIKSQGIEVGDMVLTVPHDARLPVSLTVGTVTKIQPDSDNRLLYVLDVEPPLEFDDLRRVFVIDPHHEDE